MVQAYSETDALVYLSAAESYGLPLVEAMHVGLPIVAPDLPYARAVCGGEAIYFAADRIGSLRQALELLQRRLADGWWPDWSDRLAHIPSSWSAVAHAFVRSAKTATAAKAPDS
jgi:glycosyltransferase involved in cell wall biosynthesis